MNLPSTLRFLRPGWWIVHVVATVGLFGAGIGLGLFHASGHGHAPLAPVTGNPLRDEMLDLQAAFHTLNEGVILGRTDDVEEAFHKVHARRMATEAALEAGTLRLPRNADKLEAFVERDRAFHTLLESTLKAAAANDQPQLRARSSELMDACVSCHAEYR